jgi:hypothetical protein
MGMSIRLRGSLSRVQDRMTGPPARTALPEAALGVFTIIDVLLDMSQYRCFDTSFGNLVPNARPFYN